jgi:hypothetical protein
MLDTKKIGSTAVLLVTAGLVGIISYQAAYHRATNADQTKLLRQADTYARQWSKNQLTSDRLTSDYNTACYNYQTLYAAYDKLYKTVGVGTGQPYISLPDGAKGNEDSCYR